MNGTGRRTLFTVAAGFVLMGLGYWAGRESRDRTAVACDGIVFDPASSTVNITPPTELTEGARYNLRLIGKRTLRGGYVPVAERGTGPVWSIVVFHPDGNTTTYLLQSRP